MVLVAVWCLLLASALATSPVRSESPPIIKPIRPPVKALCGKDEKYVSNSTACQVTCANRAFQDSSGGCKPFSGCVCKGDLVRLNDDATGACVTEDQCPNTQCGPNEIWSKIKITCPPQNCMSLYFLPPCARPPPDQLRPPGCNCIDGYRRNSEDICIPSEQCPTLSEILCPNPNEVWDDCPFACPPRKCGINDALVLCAADQPCEPARCRCQDGYYRNDEGYCVLFDDCALCGKDEKYVSNSTDCQVTCANRAFQDSSGGCKPFSGCVCKDDLVRLNDDATGACVTEDQCPPSCPKGENYVKDTNLCEKTCGNRHIYDVMGPCQPCSKCMCSGDLVRLNDDGTGPCVSEDQCPNTQCGPNEIWSKIKITCPPQNCLSLYFPPPCAAPPPDELRPPGCNCIDGYRRNSEDICIPSEQCPTLSEILCPNPNEVWDDCPFACPPRKCGINDASVLCAADQPCEPARCRCQDGYYRNDEGSCVLFDDCEKVEPTPCPRKTSSSSSSTSSASSRSQRSSSNYSASSSSSTASSNAQSSSSSSSSRSSSSQSAKTSSSSSSHTSTKVKPIKCGKNSTFRNCTSACPATCKPNSRACITVCKPPGCECNKGYVLHEGECILPKNCPAKPGKCGKNSTYRECMSACPATCKQPKPTVCPAVCKPAGCACNKGYVLHEGECILPKNCPAPVEKCGENSTYRNCTSACPETCEPYDGPCLAVCKPPGCQCNKGYVLHKGKCILKKECPAPVEKCGENSTYRNCTSACPATCEPYDGPCLAVCKPPGCQCNKGYVLHKGKCILKKECPAPVEKCGENSTYINCTSACPATCKPYDVPCPAVCNPPGCQCNKGYVLHKGKCILKTECPVPTCPANETYVICNVGCPNNYCPKSDSRGVIACSPPNPCPPGCACLAGYKRKSNEDPTCIKYNECPPVTCTRPHEVWNPNPPNCIRDRCEDATNPRPCEWNYPNYMPQCVCEEGYYRNASDICVPAAQCPGFGQCGKNSTYSECTSACPETCEPSLGACILVCLPPGCVCKEGYVLHEGECILKSDCPAPEEQCGENSTYKECTSACPETCVPILRPCSAACMPPGCECNEGYVLHEGKCILKKKCPVPVEKCGENSTYRNCTSACPETCEPYDGPCLAVCKPPGCQCNKGYVLHKGKCILKKECPAPVEKCGENSTYRNCTSACPDTCEPYDGPCLAVCKPPGCQCNKGYVLHKGKCILKKECPAPVEKCGENSTYKDCTSACPATCKQPKPTVCIDMCKPPGCECNEGYVLHEGKCILAGNCPVPTCPANETYVKCNVGCPTNYCPKSDSRFIIACSPPNPCPPGCACKAGYKRKSTEDPTCIKYNECPPVPCTRPHEVWNPTPPNCITDRCKDVLNPEPCNRPYPNYTPQCVCEDGYFRNNADICVPLLKCRRSCPANETFAFCKAGCPTDFCPKKEYPLPIACDPPRPCPGGCVCEAGYKRKSETENVCVKISDCAPVTCTKPNEIWTPNPPNCVHERCEDATNPRPCERNYTNYMPQCMCREGYYRNASDICVPKSECPAQCPTPEQCRPTCAVPNPPNCPKSSPAAQNVDGCECQAGFVLSGIGGKCVRIQECPRDQGCNGDPFAVPMACPWPCPSSCSSPESSRCGKTCEPVGCTCQSGYIISDKTGKCILAAECPCGDPCGPNGTFVDCGFRCPNQYCPKDDSLVTYACKPGRPCPPGCACKTNYLRKSYEEDVCVLARECPQVECTRDHEEWNPCTTECLAEGCENRFNKQPDCDPELYECQPKCVCQKGYYRDTNKKCVPADQCTKPKLCSSKCTPTCAVPIPPNCPQPRGYNETQCCESGYILDKIGGKCISIKECPKNVGCNGDPNAVTKGCPRACVPSTCKNPESQQCPAACSPGCECAPGYILSDIKGKCIKVEECPGGNPCGPNAFFANCKNSCPTDYCPIDDRRATVICETSPFAPCFSGCVCKLNHKLNNRKEKKCIVSSDCPRVPCTRLDEEWSPCPSACLSEYCEDAGTPPVTCNTLVLNCQPRCICREDHFRNATDICIPALDCVE